MPKLSDYQNKVESIFEFLQVDYQMKYSIENEYISTWENDFCVFRLGIERYDPAVHISFLRKSNQTKIYLMTIYTAKNLLGKPLYSKALFEKAQEILDPIERELFLMGDFLKTHCDDMLRGDFKLYS